MDGIDASIPLGAKQPDAMTSLANVMNVAKSAQALKLGNVELQKNEIALGERKGIQDLFSRAESFKTPDGQFDYNKLIEEGMKVAPTTFPTMVPQIIQARKLGVEAEQAFSNLNESTRAAAGQWFMGQTGKPLEQITADAEGIKRLNPALAPALDNSLKVLKMAFAGGQKAGDNALLKLGQHAMPPSQQQTAITPSGPVLNNGQTQVQMNTNPMAGPAGPVPGVSVQNVVPPTQTQTEGKDAVGNPIVIEKSPAGAITPRPMPGATTAPMLSFPPGESAQTAAALAAERQSAQTQLAQAPILHATNRGVLEEIDKVAATGTLGPRMQSLMSSLGAKFDTPEQKASAYDLVGKYLERNALQAAQGMDPHTNAALESQIRANGSVAYNPTAIKKITKLNDAIVSGAEHYQPGLEIAINSSPNQIFAKRQYDQQWAQNFDVRVMQLYNAQKAGDKAEIADILKTVGGANSQGAQELARRAKNLELLSTQGHL